MSRDPLEALLRIRKSAVDEAQKYAAEAYRNEQMAIAAVRAVTDELEIEMCAASSLAAGDETVESFARWLPIGRKRIAESHALQQRATAALDQARAVLALARSSKQTVEKTMERRKAEIALKLDRREQSILDEFASHRAD